MAEPGDELHRDRFVEAELGVERGDRCRVGALAQHHLRRIARDQPDEEKHDQRDDQQGRDRHEQAAQDIADHRAAPGVTFHSRMLCAGQAR